MPQAQIVEVDTNWGKRFRLQVTLLEKVVNVRIHSCKECDFIEWGSAEGRAVAETTLSDEFFTQLASAIKDNKNRCLPQLVKEGVIVLGKYSGVNA